MGCAVSSTPQVNNKDSAHLYLDHSHDDSDDEEIRQDTEVTTKRNSLTAQSPHLSRSLASHSGGLSSFRVSMISSIGGNSDDFSDSLSPRPVSKNNNSNNQNLSNCSSQNKQLQQHHSPVSYPSSPQLHRVRFSAEYVESENGSPFWPTEDDGHRTSTAFARTHQHDDDDDDDDDHGGDETNAEEEDRKWNQYAKERRKMHRYRFEPSYALLRWLDGHELRPMECLYRRASSNNLNHHPPHARRSLPSGSLSASCPSFHREQNYFYCLYEDDDLVVHGRNRLSGDDISLE
eukprot:PhM_4_TR16122/c7_g1_i2/m.101337